MRTHPLWRAVLCFALLACIAAPAPLSADSVGNGIITSVVNAPVSPDGDVAWRATDLVINLNRSMDPRVAGRTLNAGRSIRVTLSEEFSNSNSLPLVSYASTPECGPKMLKCNTVVLLQGWPQQPIAFAKYKLSYEGLNTIVITAIDDIVPQPDQPGIKQIHLILNGYKNPPAGFHAVEVTAATGLGGAIERGTAWVEILAHTRPSISVASVFDQPPPPAIRKSTIYQDTTRGNLVPIPYNFLVWDGDGRPMQNISIEPASVPNRYNLLQDENVIGCIVIDAPPGSTGHRVFATSPSFLTKAPVTAIPAARLQVFFQAGSVIGDYTLRFSLLGGNSIVTHVRVTH